MATHLPRDPLVAIIGATGTGKSKLAVELATRFNGEIINGDVMQMYKGLPIITNKIPEDERNSIPHHLLGTVSLASEPWTVSHFVHESQKVIREIRSRGKLPILVGGSHYYTQALLLEGTLVAQKSDTLFSDAPGKDDSRQEWPILSAPTPEIYTKLQEVDPVIAKRWHPNDRRKILRSLEIWLQTGKKASDVYEEQYQKRKGREQHTALGQNIKDGNENKEADTGGDGMRFPTIVFWLESRDETLLQRLNNRVDKMIEGGMIQEALSLEQFEKDESAKGCPPDTGKGIWISIGYKELKPYLTALQSSDIDHITLQNLRDTCIEATKIATRQYVRQQRKWIRNRLTNAFEEAGASKHLFLLDSSDLDEWNSAITDPSQRIIEMFLTGQHLPDPPSLSLLAHKSLLTPSSNGSRHQTFTSRTCEICKKTTVTDMEWEAHTASRRHKKALYGKSKKERGEARRQELDHFVESKPSETTGQS